jgi:sugar/nucleoside kinase (ribokinase family)
MTKKTSRKPFDIMVAGHLCLDMTPHIPDTGARSVGELMRPGKLVHVGGCSISTGGPVSNTGIPLKKLGNEVCFCARVGDDAFGRLTIDCMRKNGHSEGIKIVRGSSSSYTVVLVPPGIDRIFLHNPGCNDEFCAADLSPKLIGQCRHFHFGYPPLMRRMFEDEGRELMKIFKIAKKAGATTSCDMALMDPSSPAGRAPWKTILERVLPYVDICLPSIEEAFYMLEPKQFLELKAAHAGADLIEILKPEEYTRISDQLLALGAGMTSLKAGHRGLYFRTAGHEAFERMGAARPGDEDNWASRELWCPAFEHKQIVSATGSGDCSIAGFLTGFLRGLSIEESLKTAVCLGWQNLHAIDSTSGVRTWSETLKLLKEEMPLLDFRIESPGWRWNDSNDLWKGPKDRAG